MIKALVIGSIALLLTGCAARSRDRVDLGFLEGYARNAENGLTRSRAVNGIRTTVSLVPPVVGALREWKRSTDTCGPALDQLIDQHNDQLSFVLNLAADGEHAQGDVMYAGVTDLESYKQQAFNLNFSWDQYVELRCGDQRYAPVLSTLENTYGLTHDRNVVLVFAPPTTGDSAFYASETLDLVVHDAWFGTGSQHFKFQRADLQKVPAPTL
jgi:hypothetical protein